MCEKMRETVKQSDVFAELAYEVIGEHKDLEKLREVSFGVLISDKPKKSKRRVIFAECHKVPDLYKAYVPHEFLIVVYEPNVATLSQDQLKILMHHELLHIGISDTGEPYIVPHDIEEFRSIIDMYGLDWAM